jgi:hypothetical protein
MYRKSKCRISLGLVSCSCVPGGRGTLSPGIVATQCKQFCTKTLTSLAIVVHATYSLIAPSVASNALCPAERQCASTSAAAARLHARESIVHCSSSSCRQHQIAAAALLDEPSCFFAGNARTHRQRSAAHVGSFSSTELPPNRSRAG